MSYQSVHYRLVRDFGSASTHVCSCSEPASDWAYQHTGQPLQAENGRLYSDDLSDYAPMCRRCHVNLDHKHDPDWLEGLRNHMKEVGSRPKLPEQVSSAGKRGGIAAYALPETQARVAATRARNHTERRTCRECLVTSTIAGLGRHQQVSGHRGYADASIVS
jgi:hypothetical protein